MKAVLISIQPKWCGLICKFLGWDNRRPLYKKRLDLRKSKPKIELPFKAYIYCTKDSKLQFWTGNRYSYVDDHSHNAFDKCGNGKVIGEFVCDYIMGGCEMRNADIAEEMSCVLREDILKYSNGKEVFGWHISELKIYNKPKELSEFTGLRKTKFGYEPIKTPRPPQSWCYVEEV